MNNLKQKLLLCFAFVILISTQTLTTQAQETITVNGTIVDESNEPLIGVSIAIVGSQGGTRSDINGNFQLVVPATAKNLRFSYIGFDNRSVAIAANMKVTLKTASNTLEDVVVTGYQTQKKKDVTGAVANITTKDFNQGNVTNSILQIQGKVAGLSIVQSSGDPNDNPTVRLRGQTSLYGNQSPLLIVDGVQLDNIDQLSNIPPADIASYDVLKDASATAIYGSRGANGVILVTTKRGASGLPKVEYQGIVSVDNQANFRDLLNGDEYRAINGINPGDAPTMFNTGTTNTDWQRAIVRTAYTQNHSVGISGGSKGFTYRGSTNYLKQDNIIINSGKELIGIRFNAEQKALNDKLELSIGISNTITTRRRGQGIQQVNKLSPGIPLRDSDGNLASFFTGIGSEATPNIVKLQNDVLNVDKENFTQYSAGAKYTIIPGLKAGIMGNMSMFNNNKRYFRPTYLTLGNKAERANTADENYRAEANLSYDKSWGKHNFNALGLYEYNEIIKSSFEAIANNVDMEYFKDNALNASKFLDRSIKSYRADYKLISLLGSVNYNYDNKYYLTSSVRRDGASKFGVNNRWGTFYAANAAWRITQEDFMKDVLWINDLKLRVGYGETGSQSALDEYGPLRLREVGQNINPGQPSEEITYQRVQNANPNIQWEVRKGRNIGLDFALFNSRLTGDINYFNDITQKLIFEYESPTALPLANGVGRLVKANVGNLSNKGLELSLNFRAVDKKDFSWTVSGQISGVRTILKSLRDESGEFNLRNTRIVAGRQNFLGTNISYLQEGQTPFVMILPRYLGLDTNGQKLLSRDSITIDPSPRFNYGINNNFTYKNWSLGFFIRGVKGIKVYNSMLSNVESNSNFLFTQGWNTTRAGLTNGLDSAVNVVSDKWVEDASFLRLDNVNIGYTFKKVKGFQNLRIFLAGNNLLVITKFRGLDPEVQNAGNISGGSGTTSSTNYLNNEENTPRTRSFSFGINASF